MTDINEKETIEYFIHGIKKARAAAKELAVVNKSNAWLGVVKMLDQLHYNAMKLYESRPQTRAQTLSLANSIGGNANMPESGVVQ